MPVIGDVQTTWMGNSRLTPLLYDGLFRLSGPPPSSFDRRYGAGITKNGLPQHCRFRARVVSDLDLLRPGIIFVRLPPIPERDLTFRAVNYTLPPPTYRSF